MFQINGNLDLSIYIFMGYGVKGTLKQPKENGVESLHVLINLWFEMILVQTTIQFIKGSVQFPESRAELWPKEFYWPF